jgi:hypothetical protein
VRPRGFMLSGAVAFLAVAWFVLPAGQPPLYDGLGFPDEAYRFVTPPSGEKPGAPATAIRLRVAISDGVSDAAFGQSAEQGPQVAVFVPRGAVVAPAGVASVTLTLSPITTTARPGEGSVYGNVYRLAVSDGGALTPSLPGAVIRLRAPSVVDPEPVMHVLREGRWTRLRTDRVGTEIFAAPLAGAADYALVRPAAAGSSSSTRVTVALVGGVLLAITVVLGAVRRSAVRGRAKA